MHRNKTSVMKTLKQAMLLLGICLFMVSCGNVTETEQEIGEEDTKTLDAGNVQLLGEHSYLLQVADQARFMLVQLNKGEWIIRVAIPLSNTKTWNVWTKELNNGNFLAPDQEYDACMSNMEVQLVAANGKTIPCKMELTGDNVESLLSSESEATEEITAKSHETGTFEKMKAIFNQIASISIQNMNLDEIQHSVSFNSLGADSEEINFEEIYNNAKKTYDETTKQNTDKK